MYDRYSSPREILFIRMLEALIMLPTQTKLFQAECVAFVILPSVHNQVNSFNPFCPLVQNHLRSSLDYLRERGKLLNINLQCRSFQKHSTFLLNSHVLQISIQCSIASTKKETCIVKLFECQLKRGVVFRPNTLEYFLIKTILQYISLKSILFLVLGFFSKRELRTCKIVL